MDCASSALTSDMLLSNSKSTSKLTLVPTFKVLSNLISLPKSSIKFLVIESPKPVPW